MDWGQILGSLVPTGVVTMLGGFGLKEWKSSPSVESRAWRVHLEDPKVIRFSIRINNRRNTPLMVIGYKISQLEKSGDRYVVARIREHNYPIDADIFGYVRTNIRLDPFLPNMTAWPYTVIEGSMVMDTLYTSRVLFTIDAPHRHLWRQRNTIVLDLPCPLT